MIARLNISSITRLGCQRKLYTFHGCTSHSLAQQSVTTIEQRHVHAMFKKPFRPPSLLRPVDANGTSDRPSSAEPPFKKRRISPEPAQHPENDPPDGVTSQIHALPVSQRSRQPISSPRKPLLQVFTPPSAPEPHLNDALESEAAYYTTVW